MLPARFHALARALHAAPAAATLALSGAFVAGVLALWTFVFVQYGVDVPFEDQWDTPVHQLALLRDGGLTFGELARQHNEARKVVPNLVSIAVAKLAGHYDTQAELFVGPLLFAATLALLLVATRRAASRATCAAIAAVATSLAWSAHSLPFHMYSITFERLLPDLALAGGLASYALLGVGWLATLAAIALAVAAQLSFPSGLVVWPLLIAYAALVGRGRARAGAVAALAAAAIVTAALYFDGYVRPGHHPRLDGVLDAPPARVAGYWLAFLGNAFTSEPRALAAALGAIGVAAWLGLSWRALRAEPGPVRDVRVLWVVFGAYSIGLASVTTIGRAAAAFAHPMRADYLPHAVPLYVAVAALALLGAARTRRPRANALALAAALAWAAPLAGERFWIELRQHEQTRLYVKACTWSLRHHDDTECLRKAYPPASIASRVESAGALLRPPVQSELRFGAAGVGAVDVVEREGDAFVLSGWAARDGEPADAIVVLEERADHGPAPILAVARVGEVRADGSGDPLGWRARVAAHGARDPCRLRVYSVDAAAALLHRLAERAERACRP